MKIGKINERNSGHWTLDSEPKQRKEKIIVKNIQLSKIEQIAKDHYDLINSLLKSDDSNYYSYLRWNMNNQILKQWSDNGIIEKMEKKSKFTQITETKQICKLVKRKNLEFVKGLLIYFYEKIT